MLLIKIVFVFSLLLVLCSIQYLYALTPDSHKAMVYWEQASYPIQNNKAKIIIEEQDMNKYPQSIDRFNIHAYSDSDGNGITVRATENSINSGVFEAIVILTTGPSKENRLHTMDGDTITAKYIDTTLPKDHTVTELEITGTAFVGSRGPPIERAPASYIKVYNTKGNAIEEISLDQQVEIVTHIQNSQNTIQNFAYLVLIQNEKEETVSLSWIDGVLTPLQTITPSISWTPSIAGSYMATAFVWESVENPTALSPPLSIDLKVSSKQFDIEKFNKEEFVKLSLTDYKYSYDTTKYIDFGINLEGYYPTYYPPRVIIKTEKFKTIWDNSDFVDKANKEWKSHTNFNKHYDISEIGGPIHLSPGKYTLTVKFEDWKIQRDLVVEQ